MNINNMKEVLSIAHKSGEAVHMVGVHGIGKTAIVKHFAQEQGFHCEVLQLTVMDTGDLMGMPNIEKNEFGNVTTWSKPIWVQRINQANKDGKHVVLFLDELGRASADIRQAALQITLEKKIQEHSLGELDGIPTLIVVADNPSDDYDTAEFDKALEDRYISLNVETSIESWLEYARTKEILPVITDFLAEFTERLVYSPEDDGEKGSTPRAWEALSNVLKNTPKDSPLTYSLINSKVGKTVGSSFFHYFNNYINVVSVENIIDAIDNTKENISTEKGQRGAAKKISKITKKIEVISATELAEKMLTSWKNGEIDSKNILIFLASLNVEVASGIYKSWKVAKDDNAWKKDFFFGEFSNNSQENRWWMAHIYSTSVSNIE